MATLRQASLSAGAFAAAITGLRMYQQKAFNAGATSISPAFAKTYEINGVRYALDGKMTKEQVQQYEQQGFKSWLYLCADSCDCSSHG